MTRTLLSFTAAAKVMDCSRTHLYGLVAAHKLSAVNIAASGERSKLRVYADEVQEFLKASTVSSRRAS